MSLGRSNHAVHWYIDSLTSRVVAKSGISTDRFHLGKIILQNFKDAPDFTILVDGATGQSETNGSMLLKSVRCAISMRKMGLQKGDVVVLMGPTHTRMAIPFYAALYLGAIIAPVDRTLGIAETQRTFSIIRPKLVFCQTEKVSDINKALDIAKCDTAIVTFDKGNSDNVDIFDDFLDKSRDQSVKDFEPNNFNAEDFIGFFVPTSGTTGVPKIAAISYKNMLIQTPQIWSRFTNFPTPTQLALVCSPIQWMSAVLHIVSSALLRFTLLQTSAAITTEHMIYLINTYKPTYILSSPTLMTTLLKFVDQGQCNFSSLEIVQLGGSAVPQSLADKIKTVLPKADVMTMYGMTEMSGVCFDYDYPAPGSLGKQMRTLEYRLINTETNEDITEPNVSGELWVKGPPVFKGYHNDPVSTKEAFAEDGWFKSGDLFYRDEHWNFYFVDRIKLLLKYKNHQISPIEVEDVIRQHPNVADVAVTGVPDAECGDLPVAFVVPRNECIVTDQEIKAIVEATLTDSKQLRGGVVFLQQLPLTPSTKVNRKKLKEMALNIKIKEQ